MTELLPLADALSRLRAQPERVAIETVLVGEAAGRVCAETVATNLAIPPHTGAAYDGFAVRARDVATSRADTPVLLPVTGATHSGAMDSGAAAAVCGMPRTAWEVFAGAAVHSPFDAVVKLDDATVVTSDDQGAPRWVRVDRPVAAGDNIRHAGEDFAAGTALAQSGTVLRPAHLMAFATAGVERVLVRAQPRVAVLSTGRELVDDWREDLAPGQVRNSNGPYLLAMLQRHGAQPRYLRTILDDRAEFRRSLDWASSRQFPLVISSGATAASRDDFVGDVLREAGAEIVFRGLAIRPGWPVLCARLPHGGFFVGLPGNPASCAACFRVVVAPLLRVLNGLPAERPFPARLGADTPRDPQRTQILKASLSFDQACLVATPLPGQEPHRIAPLLQAAAWVLVPPGDGICAAGTLVDALMLVDTWL